MFSKVSVRFFISFVFITGFLLSGCDSKLGEKPPPAMNQEFGGTKCLSAVKPVMKAFVQGTANKAELERSWDCIGTAIEKFKRYVRGRQSDRYTSQELATFLEDNFLDQTSGVKISHVLQLEFMKIKQVFIGGSFEYLTHDEMDKLLTLIQNFRETTVNINPYIKVLSFKWSVAQETNYQKGGLFFEEANAETQKAARRLASLIGENSSNYKISDFVVFLEELGSFFGESWEFPKTINKYLPIVKKVKKALAGGDENQIAPSEWGRFTLLGSRGYIQFLRYYYFIESVPETGTGYRLSYLSRSIEDVLSVFQDLVGQKPEGIVSRFEVTEILKTLQVVWPDFKISDELVFELMKLKHLFFGGSKEAFAASDFATARLKVSRIKFLIERFLPYYSIYGREWNPDYYDHEDAKILFAEAQFVLEATAREAGQLFEGAYDLKDFHSLIAEIEKLYPPGDGESDAEELKRFLPLIVDIKNIFLGGHDSLLRQGNWNNLLGFAARFYSDFLYYEYFIKDGSLEEPHLISHVSILTNQTIDILKDLILIKKEGAISRLEINKVMRRILDLNVLPEDISAKSLDDILGLVLNNILVDPDHRIDGYVPNMLNGASLEVLRFEAQVWLNTEIFVASQSAGWISKSGFSPAKVIEILQKNLKDPRISTPLRAGLAELLYLIQSPYPISSNDQRHIYISNKKIPDYSSFSLRQLNLNRAAARLFLRSFITEKSRLKNYSGINLTEVQNVFRVLFPFLTEVKILDTSQKTFAESRFREANIFTPHSDGNTLVSFTEFSDLVGMIWSGVEINAKLEKELIRVCLNGKEKIKRNDSVNLSCIRAAYKDAMPGIMAATPEYIEFLRKSPKDEWAYYMNNVLKAAGYIPNPDSLVAVTDISLAPHVIQYIEMVFARYDKNKDGVIATAEAIKSFPSFKGVLLELAEDQINDGTLKESDLLDLFTFILRYGKPPETIKDKLTFALNWRGKQSSWDVWADRTQLAEILGYIADQVSKAPVKKP